MALSKPIEGPYGLIPSYWRIVGYAVDCSERALKIFIGAYMNRQARELNASPIPMFPIERIMRVEDGFRDGITIAEMYAFLLKDPTFEGAHFDKSPQPDIERFPLNPVAPDNAGLSPEYVAERGKEQSEGLQVTVVDTVL